MYRPTEELASDRVDSAYASLSDEDREIIDENIKAFTSRLQRKKDEYVTTLNGKASKNTKLWFGERAQLELMARLGIFIAELDPEDWKQILSWSRTRKK